MRQESNYKTETYEKDIYTDGGSLRDRGGL